MVDWEHERPPGAALLGAAPEARARPPRPRTWSGSRPRSPTQELTDLQVLLQPRLDGLRRGRGRRGGCAALREKGRGFDRADVDGDARGPAADPAPAIVPRWRRLPERGQVELSSDALLPPHPPARSATATPRARAAGAPAAAALRPAGGRALARARGARGARALVRRAAPPACGRRRASVSPEALEVLAAEGVRWAASDEGVLLRSLPPGASRLRVALPALARRGRRGRELPMLFRDRALSDVIGFAYSKVPAREAARTSSRTSPGSATRGPPTAATARPRWACSSTARTPGSTTRAPAPSSSSGSTARSRRASGSRR